MGVIQLITLYTIIILQVKGRGGGRDSKKPLAEYQYSKRVFQLNYMVLENTTDERDHVDILLRFYVKTVKISSCYVEQSLQ